MLLGSKVSPVTLVVEASALKDDNAIVSDSITTNIDVRTFFIINKFSFLFLINFFGL